MDTQTLLLSIPLATAAIALCAGIIARKDIIREGMTDARDDAVRGWEGLFKRRDENKLQDYAGKVDDYLRQVRQDAGKMGLRTEGYVMDRIETICRTLDPRNRMRKVPSLSDLRELSQQREQCSFSANLFRSLTPSILVVGIGCTLYGVHEVLSFRDVSVQIMGSLGKALLPGALAVVGTIVLFVLRGMYNKEYAALVRELDKLTLHFLLPYFQEPDPTLHFLNEYVRRLNASVGSSAEQQGVSLKEGAQIFNGALAQWSERADDCMETLTHTAERISSIGKAVRNIQENGETHSKRLYEISEDIQKRGSNLSRNAQTLLSRTYPSLFALGRTLQTVSKELDVRGESCHRLAEQKKRLDEKLPDMKEGQTILRADAKNCAQLIQWTQLLSSLIEQRKEEMQGCMRILLSHLTEQQNTMTSQVSSLSESSEMYVNRVCQMAQENESKMLRWLSWINEHTQSYGKKIQDQNKRCLETFSRRLYPSGRWGIYMRVADIFCRIRWWLYAIVFALILIYA